MLFAKVILIDGTTQYLSAESFLTYYAWIREWDGTFIGGETHPTVERDGQDVARAA